MPGITDCFVMVEQLEIWDIVPPRVLLRKNVKHCSDVGQINTGS